MSETDGTQEKKWKAVFLEALRQHGQVTKAAKRARIGRMTAYRERDADPVFAQAWRDALDIGVDALEDEARRRAFDGSDTLLIFLLKGHRPERYRERQHVQQDGSQQQRIEIVYVNNSDNTDTSERIP
jgi:hypothetical protein